MWKGLGEVLRVTGQSFCSVYTTPAIPLQLIPGEEAANDLKFEGENIDT